MREQKYANVVEEYEKKLEKEREKKKAKELAKAEAEAKEAELAKIAAEAKEAEDKKQEELSMTREIKFEEVRKQIEEDAALEERLGELEAKKAKKLEKEIAELEEVEIPNLEKQKTIKRAKKEKVAPKKDKERVTETIAQLKKLDDTIERPIEVEEKEKSLDTEDIQLEELLNSVKKKKNSKKQIESDEDKEKSGKEEDIFLTASLKPIKKKFRFGKLFKVMLTFLIVVLALGALGYFVALPMYKKYVDSRPKMIFDNTIEKLSTEYGNVFKKLMSASGENSYIDFNFRINTNDSDLYVLSNYNFGYSFGVDPNNDSLESTVYLKDGKQLYGISSIRNNDNYYLKTTTSDEYLDVTTEMSDDEKKSVIDRISYLYQASSNISEEDVDYFINKNVEILKELFDKSLITAENDEIEVDGNKIKVVKNSFKINRKDAEKLIKRYFEFINEDKRLLKIYNTLTDEEEKNREIDAADYINDLSDDYSFVFNIYTIDGTKVVGADMEEDGFRFFYYYSTEEAFNLFIDLTTDEECVNGADCNLSKQDIYEITGKKNNNAYDVKINYNGQKVADLVVRSFTIDKIDLDYEVTIKEEIYKGNVLLLSDFDDFSFNLDFSIKSNGDYVNVNLFIDLEQNKKIGIVDEKKVVKYTEKVYNKQVEDLYKSMDEEGLAEGFEFWYLIMTSPDVFVDDEPSQGDEQQSQEGTNNGNSLAAA